MAVSIGFILLGFLLLYGGGEGLVRGAGSMATRFGMSPFIIGITVVAFATSAPELAVSLQAAMAGADDVAIGNVVGSNIANIGLVLGICALIRPIEIEARILRLDLPWLIFVSVLLVTFLNDGFISRPAGLVFLIGLGAFLYTNIQVARREQEDELARQKLDDITPQHSRAVDLVLIGVGFCALVLGGAAFVRGGIGLATDLGVSPALIALTVIALGTSLPELATSVVASLKGDNDIAFGNVVGSNFFNILAILGITAVFFPLERGDITMVDLTVLLLFSLILVPLILIRNRIGRPEGLALLVGYAAYMTWLIRQG
ncbi:MAG: calcium/sodium antiporter [Gammaproteobacteria bacterium]